MYGGNVQNRAKIILEVLEVVRQAVGPDYPVLVKLNAQDFVENGPALRNQSRLA